ncbi:MAG TPA: SDR family oxidoreductase [Planctomycetaceae bacterium]|jgi:short-subunit dehydrogenase|nr:SDR family oxidoreductase [Planctomycetaceae bacterium]
MPHRRRFVLRGCTALVTGASAGIGLAVACRLASAGANLVIAARQMDKLETSAGLLRAAGVKVLAVPTDVGKRDDLERLVDSALREFGTIDVLVNNAGVEAFCHYEDLTLERIEETLRVNLTSALWLTRLVVPHMLEARRGHVVNMSSTAGKFGPAFGGLYGATKAGLITFTQAFRAEYRGRGISASVICPGFTEEGGIYDRMKAHSGRRSPALVGSTTADRVSRAVVRAIEKDVPEIIVNWPPMRPLTVFAQMFPSLGAMLVRAATVRFLKRVAESHDL